MRRSCRRIATGLCAAAIAAAAAALSAAENKACALVTLAELEAALGTKVTLTGKAMGQGPAVCTARSGTLTVLMRLAKTTKGAPDKTKAGLEMFRKLGAQIDIKQFGPITCSTMVPPANMTQYGFNTTCSVVKNGSVAAIEVTAKTQRELVPIDQLRPLAQKMVGRF